eukprot:765767-Hanusia_phi.AAC.9
MGGNMPRHPRPFFLACDSNLSRLSFTASVDRRGSAASKPRSGKEESSSGLMVRLAGKRDGIVAASTCSTPSSHRCTPPPSPSSSSA